MKHDCNAADERIRELEAELRRCNPVLAAAENRAERAEAEVKNAWSSYETVRANWEKAEAEVGRLEGIIEGWCARRIRELEKIAHDWQVWYEEAEAELSKLDTANAVPAHAGSIGGYGIRSVSPRRIGGRESGGEADLQKAEAEVERLKAEIRACVEAKEKGYPMWWDVHEGGGRESGLADRGIKEVQGNPKPTQAAANPAARKEAKA